MNKCALTPLSLLPSPEERSDEGGRQSDLLRSVNFNEFAE